MIGERRLMSYTPIAGTEIPITVFDEQGSIVGAMREAESDSRLDAIADAWNEANVTDDELIDWYELPQIRQIQVVERMSHVVRLMVALTEENNDGS